MLNYCFHTLAQEQDQSANYMPHSYVRVNTDFYFLFFFCYCLVIYKAHLLNGK